MRTYPLSPTLALMLFEPLYLFPNYKNNLIKCENKIGERPLFVTYKWNHKLQIVETILLNAGLRKSETPMSCQAQTLRGSSLSGYQPTTGMNFLNQFE